MKTKKPNINDLGLAARWKQFAESTRPQVAPPKADLCKRLVGHSRTGKAIRCNREKRNFPHTQRTPGCEGTLRYGCRLHDNVCGGCAALVPVAQ